VEGAFRSYLADKPFVSWFDGVFGRRDNTSYLVTPAFFSGDNNWSVHAIRPDGAQILLLAMSVLATEPGRDLHWLFAHETAHSYVNPVIDAHFDELKDAVTRASASVTAAMAKQAYTTPIIVAYESVVRAIQVMYLRERVGEASAQLNLAEQHRLSFLWTDILITALDDERKRAAGRLSDDTLVRAARTAFEQYYAKMPR
jgi:hypothetical protein